jgi:hypothetical protein
MKPGIHGEKRTVELLLVVIDVQFLELHFSAERMPIYSDVGT